ncbi:MAG: hypothetical protein ACK502_04080 [Alphaproteobacteria bacterium]
MSKPSHATQAAFLTTLLAAGCSDATQQHYPKLGVSDFLGVVKQDVALLEMNMTLQANLESEKMAGDLSVLKAASDQLRSLMKRIAEERDETAKLPKKDRSNMSPELYKIEIIDRLKAQYAQLSKTEREQFSAELAKLKAEPSKPVTDEQARQELKETKMNDEIAAYYRKQTAFMDIESAFKDVDLGIGR